MIAIPATMAPKAGVDPAPSALNDGAPPVVLARHIARISGRGRSCGLLLLSAALFGFARHLGILLKLIFCFLFSRGRFFGCPGYFSGTPSKILGNLRYYYI